jgi:PAS domain S-box-containing protein
MMTIVAWNSVVTYVESSGSLAHDLEVMAELGRVRTALAEIGADSRAFVITGNEKFIKPSTAATDEARNRLRSLKLLLGANSSQQHWLDTLDGLVSVEVEFARQIIRERIRAGLEPARQLILSERGIVTLEQIGEIVDKMEQEEQRFIDARTGTVQQSIRSSVILFAILMVLIFVLFAVMYVLIQRELAGRRRAEAEIRSTKDLLDSVVQNIPTMLFLKDARDLRFVRFNKAGEDLLGFREGELLGRNDYDFFPKDEADFFVAKDREVLASDAALDIPEEPIQTRHNTTRILHTRKIALRDADGVPQFLLGISVDITERKKAENVVRSLNEELQQRINEVDMANKELESFSYSVSHDLRAPLRSIDGFSQLLLQNKTAGLDPQGQEWLSRIRANAQRMSQLIDDLLNLSRISRTEMVSERVNLSAIAASILDDLRRAQPERRVTVAIQEGLIAEGDPRLMKIVLENLLANAWKYTRKVEMAKIDFGMSTNNGTSWYYIRDNGAGFEMKYAEKLFGPFQRLHSMTEFEGTGIGLATVARIVRRHGGKVWAEGEVDRGATFYFSLS